MACSCWQGTFHCSSVSRKSRRQSQKMLVMAEVTGWPKEIWEGYFSWMENRYFHLLLSLNLKCFHNSETQLFQTLITRQSYGQQMRYYNIKQPALPISVRNSERIPGLSLTGDSELTVWEIFFISAADKICHWWSENSVLGKKKASLLIELTRKTRNYKIPFFPPSNEQYTN